MVDLTKDNFEEEVLKAEGTVLVDFYGDGCYHARLLCHISMLWRVITAIRSNSPL